MMDSNTRMIETQAKLISKLNDEVRSLRKKNESLEISVTKYLDKFVEEYCFVRVLENLCAEDQNVRGSFEQLMLVLKLLQHKIDVKQLVATMKAKIISEIKFPS